MAGIITIAGASGVVGRHLINLSLKNGYKIRILSRKSVTSLNIDYFSWSPGMENSQSLQNTINALEGAEILINLAGASLSEGRLNSKLQKKIMESRIDSTKLLIEAYKLCVKKPKIWAQASAVGYYGDTGNADTFERSKSGNLFLSSVCVNWEKLLLEHKKEFPELKTIIARFGLVLAKDAPAWQKILKPIKMGFGGPIGSGNQWYSWIDADDIAGAFFHLFKADDKNMIFNFTAPYPEMQKTFTKKIAGYLHRPAIFKLPGFLLKLLLGKGAGELLLTSCRAIPENLIASGYKFENDTLDKEILKLLSN